MVQGTTKAGQSKPHNNARRARKAAANTKKGRRTVAPKKATAIKQASMHKASFLLIFFSTSPYHFLFGTPAESCHIGIKCQDQ
jgi:hypothetical protein